MNPARQWILVISNVIIAVAVSYFVFLRSGKETAQTEVMAAPATAIEVDLSPLIQPIESLETSFSRYAETLQRFNTSLVQYDFLQKEIQRIANLDQLVGNQLNIELQAKEQLGEDADESASESADETIGQIREFQTQVQTELEQRRQMLFQLIAGLEEQLAKSAGEDSIQDVTGDSPPTPTPPAPPNPNLLPAPTGD